MDSPDDVATHREGARAAIGARLQPGETLGRYVVSGPLGEGGMGVVYLARDPELARDVALKLVRVGKGSDAQQRLLREAQAMARLSHPNVVAIYDVGTYGQKVFLALELVKGETLRRWLAREPRGWREIVRVFRDAGQGLAAAHDAGMVHRDFKLDNVMIDASGRARVTDFGLARALDEDDAAIESSASPEITPSDRLATPLTEAGAVVGTPAYMAPEQRRAARGDARADQFSFCVSMYEALYKARPSAAGGTQLRAPAGTKVPSWIQRILVRGLAQDPEQRWPSMRELLAALGRDPAVTRRWIVAGGAAACAAAAIAWFVLGRHASPACDDSDAAFGDTWTETKKIAVHAAFAKTQREYAEEVFASVARGLDRAATDWKAARTDVCRATRTRRAQSEEVMLLRMACLERQRTQFAALVNLLSAADGKTVELAVQATGGLARPSECEDVRSLSSTAKLPDDPNQRAEIERLRLEIASASALTYAKPRDAVGRFEIVVARAKQIGYRPLEAEAAYGLGFAHVILGESATAKTHLEAAAFAAEAGGSDWLAARACARLVAIVANRGLLDEARSWAARARAILERIGSDPTTESLLGFGVAFLERSAGHHEESVAAFRRVVAMRTELLGPDHTDTLLARANLASELDELARADEAIAEGSAVVAGYERTVGPHHPRLALPLLNLGLVALRTGRYDEAERFIERAAVVAQASFGPRSHYLGATHLNRAELRLEQGRAREAREEARVATEIIREAVGERSDLYGWALGVEGAAAVADGQRREGIELLERGIAVRTAIDPKLPNLARDLTWLGEALLAARRTKDAVAALDKALGVSEGRPRFPGELARTRLAAARARAAAGEHARARELASLARDELAGVEFRAPLLAEVRAFLAKAK